MAGNICSAEKLNLTLLKIAHCFKKNNFKMWFIAYGTLLGIVRNNSCINGDDDIDIICDNNDFHLLKKILIQDNFELEYGYGIGESTKIIKTKETEKYASIDFYMTDVNLDGDFYDGWEKVIWEKCFVNKKKEFINLEWQGINLNLPKDYIKKLRGRYGANWTIPSKFKGIQGNKIQTLILSIFFRFPFKIRQKIKSLIFKNNNLGKYIKTLFSGRL